MNHKNEGMKTDGRKKTGARCPETAGSLVVFIETERRNHVSCVHFNDGADDRWR